LEHSKSNRQLGIFTGLPKDFSNHFWVMFGLSDLFVLIFFGGWGKSLILVSVSSITCLDFSLLLLSFVYKGSKIAFSPQVFIASKKWHLHLETTAAGK